MLTAENIAAAALAYNRDYPEAVAFVAAGTAELLVTATAADRYGNSYRYVVTPGVRGEDGTFAAAADPTVVTWRRRDGREDMRREAICRRAARRAYPGGWDVPLVARAR